MTTSRVSRLRLFQQFFRAQISRVYAVIGPDAQVVLQGHAGVVHSVAISPDGKKIATCAYDAAPRIIITGTDDRTVRIWNADGSGTAVVLKHESHINSAAYSLDGETIVTGSFDKTARIWVVG